MEEIIAAVLIVGDAIAHGHQIFVIMRDEHTKGLSTASIVLNCISSYFVTLNLIILEGNYFLKEAWFLGINHRSIDAWCAVMQMVTSAAYTSLLVLAYNLYAEPKEKIKSTFIVLCSILFQLFLIVISRWVGGIRLAGTIFGIMAMVITIVAWLPQIWLLFRRNERGELSLYMVLAHLLGSWLAVFFQAVLNAEDWSTWLSSVVMGLEQCLLLALWLRARYSGN